MARLATFDITHSLGRHVPPVVAQMGFGAACAACMLVLQIMVDFHIPPASPFALVYPTVLLATLYGRWRAGLTAWLLALVAGSYFLEPFYDSLDMAETFSAQRTILNGVSSLIVVMFAELFRRTVRVAMAERNGEIDRRIMLMRELEHRTKNNFALVVSVLEMQKRNEDDPHVQKALELATARIHSFARAYANLAESQGEGEKVQMKPYLEEVVRHFSGGAFHDEIEVAVDVSECVLPRQVAVAIGLFTNEALTNSAKYAFTDGRGGKIEVRLACNSVKWELVVADDGMADTFQTETEGLGTKLLAAFARQADADYSLSTAATGRHLTLASN